MWEKKRKRKGKRPSCGVTPRQDKMTHWKQQFAVASSGVELYCEALRGFCDSPTDSMSASGTLEKRRVANARQNGKVQRARALKALMDPGGNKVTVAFDGMLRT